MTQDIIVALIVGGALLYSLWVLLPAVVRRAAAARVARQASRWGLGEPQAARLRTTLEAAGACSECSQCKGCATAKGNAAHPPGAGAVHEAVTSTGAAPTPH
jgi:hypothetical protein